MLSNKPYLLRAFYQWIVDNDCTPILVIDATQSRVNIPENYVEGGEIVFNISPSAIRDLKMLNDFIEFKASFSGVIHLIYSPIKAILALYAEENGEGIFFDPEEESDGSNDITTLREIEGSKMDTVNINTTAKKTKPFLKLVE